MSSKVSHEERRHQIAEAMVTIAATRGLHAASMREVAAEAGVSLRLVQYYFQTKEELLRAVLQRLGTQLGRRMAHAVAGSATPRSHLRDAMTALLPTDEESRRIVLAYTAHYTLTLTEPHLAPTGLAHAGALHDLITAKFREAAQAGELRPDVDPGRAAPICLALVTGLQSAVLAGQHTPQEATGLLGAHLDGLFTPASAEVNAQR
ncbi:TetR/AcrR family transcriptional regulator [Nonomuraea sp. NPDC055795]